MPPTLVEKDFPMPERDRIATPATALLCFLGLLLGGPLFGCAGAPADTRGRASAPLAAGATAGPKSTSAAADTANVPSGSAGSPALADLGSVASGTANGLPPNVCESVGLVANPQIPEMMIVLDRSGSMQEGERWTPSVSAVRGITMALESKIDFGLVLFPDPGEQVVMGSFGDIARCLTAPDPQACLDEAVGGNSNGGINISINISGPACAPGRIAVPTGAANAGAIEQVLQNTFPQGGTPTSGTLEGLLSSYAQVPINPDEVPQPKYLLLVTDGQPTCPAGQGSTPNPEDIAASNLAIDALTNAGVKTYVIGYDTSGVGNEELARVLDDFAARGGTGDTQHRPVEDEASLIEELRSILGEVASCSLLLDAAPASPEYVRVTLDSQQVNLNDDDGWRLVDGSTVELVGQACQTFKSGTHRVEATVECDIVAPQ